MSIATLIKAVSWGAHQHAERVLRIVVIICSALLETNHQLKQKVNGTWLGDLIQQIQGLPPLASFERDIQQFLWNFAALVFFNPIVLAGSTFSEICHESGF